MGNAAQRYLRRSFAVDAHLARGRVLGQGLDLVRPAK